MAWIEVHQSLVTHRKTLALADALDIPPVHAMGHLVALWLWSIDNAPDGRLDNVKPRTIALASQWTGDPAAFIDALTGSSFLESDGSGFVIHDWMDYAGRLVERRAENAKRMRDARAKNRPHVIEERAENVQDTCDARAGATVPNPTVPDHTSITNVIDVPTVRTPAVQALASNGKQVQSDDSEAKNAAHAAPPSGGNHSKKSLTKKERPKHDKASHNAMFDAIIETYGIDVDSINDSERGMVNRAATCLLDSHLNPEDVPRLRGLIAMAYPTMGTIPPTMLPKYVYLLKNPPKVNGKNGSATNGRAVDRSSLNATIPSAADQFLENERRSREDRSSQPTA